MGEGMGSVDVEQDLHGAVSGAVAAADGDDVDSDASEGFGGLVGVGDGSGGRDIAVAADDVGQLIFEFRMQFV